MEGVNILEKIKNHKSSILNMEANQIALIAYLSWIVLAFIPVVNYFAWAVPLVIYFVEKSSDYVRKQAAQAFTLYAIGAILTFLVSVVFRAIFVSAFSVNTDNFLDVINNFSAGASAAMIIGAISTIIFIGITAIAVIALIKVCGYEKLNIPVINKITTKLEELIGSKSVQNDEVKEEKTIVKKTTTKKETK